MLFGLFRSMMARMSMVARVFQVGVLVGVVSVVMVIVLAFGWWVRNRRVLWLIWIVRACIRFSIEV